MMRFLFWSLVVIILGLVLATWIGWQYSGSLAGAATFLMVGTVLAVLLGSVRGIEIGLVPVIFLAIASALPDAEVGTFLFAAIAGLLTFLAVEMLNHVLDRGGAAHAVGQAGIGAMYVRSMTIMLVEKETLAEFRYLEHGAFWSILTLSGIMFVQTLAHVPDLVTGLLGAGFIGLAFLSSLSFRRAHAGPHAAPRQS